MAPASPPQAVPAGSDPMRRTGWKRWLLLGACFGLGYGIPQRLLSLDLKLRLSSPERFSVQPFPGTELNSLRRRSGKPARRWQYAAVVTICNMQHALRKGPPRAS